jgi:hypothetical protein
VRMLPLCQAKHANDRVVGGDHAKLKEACTGALILR